MSASASAAVVEGRDLCAPATWGGNEEAARRLQEFLDEKGGKGWLFLNGCNLKELPPEIGELTGMTRLDAGRNFEMKSLPDTLGQLESLEMFSCAATSVSALPESLQYCKRLRMLFCQDTKLTELPSWIGELEELEVLKSGDTTIAALPESLAHCKRLSTLWLNNTKLSALPSWMGELTALKSLTCSNTPITALPESLVYCTQLSVLEIGRTKVNTLPDWIGELAVLEVLCCTDTYITTLPTSLCRCSKLRSLFLEGCNSLEFPPRDIMTPLLGSLADDKDSIESVLTWLREHDGARKIKGLRA